MSTCLANGAVGNIPRIEEHAEHAASLRIIEAWVKFT
jgi:hypothetical protein